ncbi:hypothetical protein B9K02_00180 [Lentilactobacillus kefiri]|uniref:Bax inhibitor-1/YccA family protein n=1 Tax=Lentilactobacillus kefiri TaxID=33962 RepID=UPI000BA4F904|nr:Bax inhibitor-1/YccA family protein [Lentilactobacillus kefiri]PAK60532.1 hypothetical protein B9K02_00180 [Lentilactobacillus kefiri]
MNNYPNEQPEARKVVNNAAGLNTFLTKIYGWMSLAVLVSAATAFLVSGSVAGGMAVYIAAHRGVMWGSVILWFFLPIIISIQALKRPTLAFTVLMLYSILSGFVFATVAWAYTGASIAAAFVSASAIFITMTTVGLVTNKSLDCWGAQATAALIALVIAMVINIFLRSSMISFVLSIIAVIIFTVLTAYDTQKMKQMYNQYAGNGEVSMTGLAVFGALQLYLDFVNLFIQLLSIFGNNER